jgi:hypothetical protein
VAAMACNAVLDIVHSGGVLLAVLALQEPCVLMLRANSPASLSLYWMCGLVWYYRGTLREMWTDLKWTVIKSMADG